MKILKKLITENGIYSFEVKVEKSLYEVGTYQVILPVYATPIGIKKSDYITSIDEAEFDEDIKKITPYILGDDYGESCWNQFQIVIKNHIEKYNRITPGDLETYVTMFVMILSVISKGSSEPLNETSEDNLFMKILTELSNHLGLEIKVF